MNYKGQKKEEFYCYKGVKESDFDWKVLSDPEQLAAVNAALAKADKWSAWHNCAAFGAAVWNTVCTDKVDPGTPPTPASLAASVRRYPGKCNADPAVPFDYVVYYGYPAVPSKEFA